MLCSRKKARDIKMEEKWDFISLQDFKASSFFEYLAYVYLWVSLFISVAVYGVDTFTAYNLLALGKFTGLDPAIPLNISKWIFAGCIIASWVNVFYEHVRAHMIIKRGAVAESYLDSLAVRLQSIRIFGRGRGWKRFLVFSELTKSKKGAEYVALFTYFSFQSWIRVIFCSGPRQVINALTLRSVYMKNLDPKDKDAATSIVQFFKNFGILAEKDHKQAVVLSGMVFTLVIWIFAALSLLLALCFYLLFLWHYIPNGDGGLSGYCERKINGRLQKIVSVKINKAIQDEENKRMKADRKAFKNGEKPVLGRQATLPTLFDTKSNDKLPSMPMLGRNETTTTLPMYSSRPGTPSSQQPTLPGLELSNMDQKRPVGPSRLNTAASGGSFGPTSGLVTNAADMGYARSGSPAPTMPSLDGGNGMPYPQPQRSLTGTTNSSMGQGQGGSQWNQRGPQQMRNGPPSRAMTQDSYGNVNGGGPNGPSRQMTQDSYGNVNGGGPPGPSRQMTQDSYGNGSGPLGPSRQMTQDSYGAPQRNMNNTPFDRNMNNTPLDRTMNNTPLDLDRTMNNMTPMDRTASPLSYSRPVHPSGTSSFYSQAPSALSHQQDAYSQSSPLAPPQRKQTHDSYDPYSTAHIGRVTQDSTGTPLDDEPTLPNLDMPAIVVPRSESPVQYAPSIASSQGHGSQGHGGNGSAAQTRYAPGGRSTPSQGSIESSVGRRTPLPLNDAASVVSERTSAGHSQYSQPQSHQQYGGQQTQYGQPQMQSPPPARVAMASPTGGFAQPQPVRSASAGLGAPNPYGRPQPGRNVTEPVRGPGYGGQQGGSGYNGGGGYGGQGYRM